MQPRQTARLQDGAVVGAVVVQRAEVGQGGRYRCAGGGVERQVERKKRASGGEAAVTQWRASRVQLTYFELAQRSAGVHAHIVEQPARTRKSCVDTQRTHTPPCSARTHGSRRSRCLGKRTLPAG